MSNNYFFLKNFMKYYIYNKHHNKTLKKDSKDIIYIKKLIFLIFKINLKGKRNEKNDFFFRKEIDK